MVFFSHPLFIPDPTGRKQNRKITVDRVILFTLRLARVLLILVDARRRKIFDFEYLYTLLFIFQQIMIDWYRFTGKFVDKGNMSPHRIFSLSPW